VAKDLARDTVAAELAAIKGRSKDGMLHPAHVVEWAKSHKDSALHSQFDWNVRRAAREHWLWQARRLIQIVINDPGEAPKVVSLRYDRRRGGGYRDVDDVIESRELSSMMLADALADLERVKLRYAHIKELTAVWEAVEDVKRKRKQAPSEKRAAV
jgi:hypothetical protein